MSKYANQIKFDGNVVRWVSSDNIPFSDVLGELLADGVISQDQVDASVAQKAVEDAQSIARYVAFREAHGYSDEELAEIRCEFGDEEVVDIFTGKAVV